MTSKKHLIILSNLIRFSDSIDQIRISYYNNVIKNVTKLPPLPGKKISLGFTANQIVEIEESAFSNVERIISLDLGSNHITGKIL